MTARKVAPASPAAVRCRGRAMRTTGAVAKSSLEVQPGTAAPVVHFWMPVEPATACGIPAAALDPGARTAAAAPTCRRCQAARRAVALNEMPTKAPQGARRRKP